MTERIANCIRCGVELKRKPGLQKYCSQCRQARDKELRKHIIEYHKTPEYFIGYMGRKLDKLVREKEIDSARLVFQGIVAGLKIRDSALNIEDKATSRLKLAGLRKHYKLDD